MFLIMCLPFKQSNDAYNFIIHPATCRQVSLSSSPAVTAASVSATVSTSLTASSSSSSACSLTLTFGTSAPGRRRPSAAVHGREAAMSPAVHGITFLPGPGEHAVFAGTPSHGSTVKLYEGMGIEPL
jgi:hypothetical protein